MSHITITVDDARQAAHRRTGARGNHPTPETGASVDLQSTALPRAGYKPLGEREAVERKG